MTDDITARLKRLGREYHRSKARTDRLRDQLRDTMIEAKQADMKTTELARNSEYDREMVRRIINQAKADGRLPADEEGQA